jgi:hypothetical protein
MKKRLRPVSSFYMLSERERRPTPAPEPLLTYNDLPSLREKPVRIELVPRSCSYGSP